MTDAITEPETDDGFEPLPSHYHRCFGCGEDVPGGMHMKFWGNRDALRVRGSFTVSEDHQGAPRLAHGGVIAAAVDEGMGYLLWLLAKPAVTAHLEVDYRTPVPVGSTLEMEAEIDRTEGRKIYARLTGTVDGRTAVDATAIYVTVGIEHFRPYFEQGEERADRPTYNP